MTYQKGEKNSSARLSEDDVRAIRRDQHVLTRRELAEKYGVSLPMISMIITRRRWKHVE